MQLQLLADECCPAKPGLKASDHVRHWGSRMRNPRLGSFRSGRFGMYSAVLAGLIVLAGTGATVVYRAIVNGDSERTSGVHRTLPAKPNSKYGAGTGSVTGHVILTQDDWIDRIRTRDYWEGRGGTGSGPSKPNISKPSAPEKPSKLGVDRAAAPPVPVSARETSQPRPVSTDGTFRTLCVRLCDGSFYPISFATTEEYFERDQKRCQSSCNSPARLYVYKNPNGEIEEMKDLDDQPYSRLKTAFLYRTKYDSACKCTPHPWEQQAVDRHRLYALEAARQMGDKIAAKTADELKSKIEADKRKLRSQKKSASTSATNDGASPDSSSEPKGRNKKSATATTKPQRLAPVAADQMPEIMRLGATMPPTTKRTPRTTSTTTGPGRRTWQAKAFGDQ